MNLVADHLGAEIVEEEAGADEADVAVVEGRHLVAEVRQVTQTRGVDGLELLVGALGVAGGGDDAHLQALTGELGALAHLALRGEGDLADGGDGVEALHLLDVRLAQEGGVLGAAAGGVDERPFEVDAEHLGVLLVLAVFGHVPERLLKILRGDGEGGGAPRRAPFLQFRLGDRLDGRGVVRVADVHAGGAVGVDIDEAGHDEIAFRVVHPVRVGGQRRARLEDFGDLAVLDDDCPAVELISRADDVGVLDETFGHDLLSFEVVVEDSVTLSG